MNQSSTADINQHFSILADLIQTRIRACLTGIQATYIFSLPTLPKGRDLVSAFVQKNKLSVEEHYVLLMGLAPHIRPEFFDHVIQEALGKPGDFPPIGGVRGKQFRGFLPTAETALFILNGGDWWTSLQFFREIFHPEHVFNRNKILWLEQPPDGEPLISGKMIMNQSLVTYFTTGEEYLPHYSAQFPAQLLNTSMKWSDVVLSPATQLQLDEIRKWLHHHKKLMSKFGMSRKLGPGYRALFYGPPGTGKTLSATLLGKEFRKYVFRVDLSNLVSKYIGETEKNLARLFDEAEHKDWILFFDEADSIFGKRTQVKDAHDRYANQEVSYLMQRIESFAGLVILASNLRGNMDEAFTRRMQSIIYFPYPTPEEQVSIWEKAFPQQLKPVTDINLLHYAQRYKLSGANIMNIVQYCCLCSLAEKGTSISPELFSRGIQRELLKEGKASQA